MDAATQLCRQLERALPDRPFTLELWNGARVEATHEQAPTIGVRSPDAITQVLRAPGELGLGRAYVLGELEVDDLEGVVRLLGRWHPPRIAPLRKATLALTALRAAGLHRPHPKPAAELPPAAKRHNRKRDSEAVRHHYDLSNEFFKLFLDESMTYSCALFDDGAETLEQAQWAKLHLVCRKLDLGPDRRVLDIGCGWGSFAIHAAREFGASVLAITVSPQQAALATERVATAGLSDLVEVRLQDYRELGDERFDAISSIGMIEHVGESQIDDYASVISAVLKPGGRVLNHGITWTENTVHIGAEFSDRYVFPDGEIPPLSRVLTAFERAGLEPLHVENLHRHYSWTLNEWAERLDQNLVEAERLAGPERLRVWRLYLRASRNGFDRGLTSIFQTLLVPVIRISPDEPRADPLEFDARRSIRDSRATAFQARSPQGVRWCR